MAIFLSDRERAWIRGEDPVARRYRWALAARCARRTAQPGFGGGGEGMDWWFCAYEALGDAALHHAVSGDAAAAAWLRSATLAVARRGEADWVGPWFRDHDAKPALGNLETAHLAWSVAAALDLAPGAFSAEEREELAGVLRERGMALCRRRLAADPLLNNWRCVLTAGVAVPAAVLGDEAAMDEAAGLWRLAGECFQEDGSSPESLQYGHYAAHALMLAWEALVRRRPALAADLPLERYARGMPWVAASMLYRKPLGGAWGGEARPRAVNFGDSAAAWAPGADLLLHVAARCRERLPAAAGLARWLHDTYCPPVPDAGPHDASSFGFVPRSGILAPALLAQAAPALAPAEAGLGRLLACDNGDVLVRDAWGGGTVLAVRTGGAPLNGSGHLHGDLNACVLAHAGERLLVDPGHSCYRGLLHGIEVGSDTHCTLTFAEGDRCIGQTVRTPRREHVDGHPGPAVGRGGRRLVAAVDGPVAAVGGDAAGAYGAPVQRAERFWILCGSRALFVIDRVRAERPLRTTWNWLLNDRDGGLELKVVRPDRLVARRGAAGLKLFHLGGGIPAGPLAAWMHDSYHPLPGRLGEGASGSGRLVRWSDAEPTAERCAVTAIALDDYGAIAGWHMHPHPLGATLEGPGKREAWSLDVDAATGAASVRDEVAGQAWRLAAAADGAWRLERTS